MGKTDDNDNDPIIEIVSELDNAMFLLALAGGIVLGVVLIYGWQEYQKQQGEKRTFHTSAIGKWLK